MIYLGVKIHIFEVLSNIEFTKIIQYPEYKSANISDREKVMVQEKEEGIQGSRVLEKVRNDQIQNTSREVGLRFKQGYFFFLRTKEKAECRMWKPLISYLFWGKSLNLLNLIHQIIITPTLIGLLKNERKPMKCDQHKPTALIFQRCITPRRQPPSLLQHKSLSSMVMPTTPTFPLLIIISLVLSHCQAGAPTYYILKNRAIQ